MAEVRSYDERRRFSRIAFHRPAQLDSQGERITGELLDVSLKGALLEVPRDCRGKPGEACSLAIRLDGADTVIRMDGEIAHRRGIMIGVRCDEIDLDSIAHLRRLVELNLGDEALLHRELAALISDRAR
jgi:hypothetical protein